MNPGWDSVNVPPMYLGCRKPLETMGLETQTLGFSREIYSKHLVLEVGLSKRFGLALRTCTHLEFLFTQGEHQGGTIVAFRKCAKW